MFGRQSSQDNSQHQVNVELARENGKLEALLQYEKEQRSAEKRQAAEQVAKLETEIKRLHDVIAEKESANKWLVQSIGSFGITLQAQPTGDNDVFTSRGFDMAASHVRELIASNPLPSFGQAVEQGHPLLKELPHPPDQKRYGFIMMSAQRFLSRAENADVSTIDSLA